MVRTRVGYAGGTKLQPTYHSLGDHTETIEMDYDPQNVSFADLLDVFWNSHNPASLPWSRQYASILFVHDEEQRQLAEASKQQQEAELGRKIYTEILPYNGFTLAEDYHQKYRLRNSTLLREYQIMYPGLVAFVDSTAVTRVNGYLGGHGSPEQLESEIDMLGLSEAGKGMLRRIAAVSHR